MPAAWPALPYEDWVATCDTLHAHTQLLGKLAVALAPPEPQLQHATYDTAQVETYFAAATRVARPTGARGVRVRLAVAPAARWEDRLGEFVLDWDDVIAAEDPHAAALGFARSAFREACLVCGWDHALAASGEGTPPPVA